MIHLEEVILGFSLKYSCYFIYAWGIPVMGSISSRASGTMSAVLVGVGSFVGVSQVLHLLCELLWELPLVAGSYF